MYKKIISAVLSAVIVAILGYIGSLTNVFALDVKALINIAILTGVTSFLKAISTTVDGKFAGTVQVK